MASSQSVRMRPVKSHSGSHFKYPRKCRIDSRFRDADSGRGLWLWSRTVQNVEARRLVPQNKSGILVGTMWQDSSARAVINSISISAVRMGALPFHEG